MKGSKPDGKKARQKKTGNRQRKISAYTMEVFVIAIVLVAALLIPQFIFQVQDSILCGGITLGQRESLDVETLGTTYEQSLEKRMQSFAEGLAEHESFYVTAQTLTPDETLESYLYSDLGLNHQLIMNFIYNNLIPIEVWENYYTITQWKQYVIYSDNYAKGVNFILWYIELEDLEGAKLKLLVDAEDNTLYGLKTENSSLAGGILGYANLQEALRFGGSAVEVWTYYSLYYKAVIEDAEKFLYWAEKMGIMMDSFSASLENNRKEAAEAERQIQRMVRYQCETEERARFVLPYGGATLDAILAIEEQDSDRNYFYPNITAGIRQIYEMIPEFA